MKIATHLDKNAYILSWKMGRLSTELERSTP